MNKLIRAASMLSLGTASLALTNHTAVAQDTGRPWQLSAALSGFYDDNIYTAPSKDPTTGLKNPAKVDSFGFEVKPSIKYAITPQDGTSLSFQYTYSARYYEHRPAGNDNWDQSHFVNLSGKHTVSPRLSLEAYDRFAYTQESAQDGVQGATVLPFRTKGSNISNHGGVAAAVELATSLSAVVGYRNDYYNYEDVSYKARLNRIEHNPSLDLRYQLDPTLTAFVGYRYGLVDYNSGLLLAPGLPSSLRDSQSHYITAGADKSFSDNLKASLRGGVQIVDYTKSSRKSDVSPYVDANLTYVFQPGSSAQVGVRHEHNATDVFNPTPITNEVVQDQESTTSYLQLTHAVTARITAKGLFQYQNSKYVGGAVNGKTEDLYTAGLTLSYMVTSNVFVDASYNYDRLISEAISFREFTRNRVSLGVRGTF